MNRFIYLSAFCQRLSGYIIILLLFSNPAAAATYPMPATGERVIGELQQIRANSHETLLDIGSRHGLGYEAMVAANPRIDPWLPEQDAMVTLPTQFILPNTPREGIVINLPEMRLYYYPKSVPGQPAVVITYPISIGSEGRELPIGLTHIGEKRVNPVWNVPKSIRAEHARDGEPLAAVVPPGPDNPLGNYAMRLDTSSYLIHGTNRSFSIGMRISHGCIRMYPDDIEALFPQVPSGTAVRIVNQPFKAGWRADELYVEAHAPLKEPKYAPKAGNATEMVAVVVAASNVVLDDFSWDLSRLAAEEQQGIPTKIIATQPGQSLLGNAAAKTPGLNPGDTWWLQVGAYSNIDNARQSANRIGELPQPLSTNLVTNGHLCHVVIGPFTERAAALSLGKSIHDATTFSGFPLQGVGLTGYRYCLAGVQSGA